MKSKPPEQKRPYSMRARAVSADATRQRILEAAQVALWMRRTTDVHLEEIAERAAVSVQTVLRTYGSRAALLGAAMDILRERVFQERESAEPGDIAGTISALFDHYEEVGDFTIRALADEPERGEMHEHLEVGRTLHRRSMERQFAPQLVRYTEPERTRVVDCLVVACDVYAWKLLRHDMGRSRMEVEACVCAMVDGILKGEVE